MASQWYVRSKGKVYGPLDSKSLKQLAVDGKIDGSTEVAQSESGPWSAANKVRGLINPPLSPSSSQPTATSSPPVVSAVASNATSPLAPHRSAKKQRGSYVDANLLPGEQVVYRGNLHWWYFLRPIEWFMLAALMLSIGKSMNETKADSGLGVIVGGAIVIFIALGSLIGRLVGYWTSEFAITNKRVIMKQGFIRRRTLELLLGKVDSLSVDQGIIGRLVGFGTVRVTVATEKQAFTMIARPLEFRRQVQAQAPT